MQLTAGERIDDGNRAAYIIDDRESATKTSTLYRARKIFFSYRYERREYYEAGEDEWIDVWIRGGAAMQDESEELLRERLRYESTMVLSRLPGWFPEPIDLLEHHGRPLLVTSNPHGRTLREWKTDRPDSSPSPQVLRIVGELLNLLEDLHRNEQLTGGFGPDEIRIDEAGRLCFTATDRIVPLGSRISQQQRFDLDDDSKIFSSPESRLGEELLSRRSDLYSWAALFRFLILDQQAESEQMPNRADSPCDERLRQQFDESLQQLAHSAPHTLRSISPKKDRRTPRRIAAGWSDAVARCLVDDPSGRPESVAAVRRIATASGPLAALSRFRRRRQRGD